MFSGNDNLGLNIYSPTPSPLPKSDLGKAVLLSVVAGLITKVITTYIWRASRG
jgi:hypothetical protein